MEDKKEIHDGFELYDYLIRRKTDDTYYRGQQKEFNCPLVPSWYRGNECELKLFFIEDKKSLRNKGNYFYHYFFTLLINSSDEKILKRILADANFCVETMLLFQNAFGYLLSQIIAQQIGFTSQALDVTDDLSVAFFFAMVKYQDGVYRIKDKDDECSVIYEWVINDKVSHLKDLNSFDYFNCPEIINSKSIVSEFGLCDTYNEYLASIARYKEEIHFNSITFNIDEIANKRPFEIIKFPRGFIQKTRVVNQSASLLIPDCYLSKELLAKTPFYKDPPKCDMIEKGILLEELSKKQSCKKYYFKSDNYREFCKILRLEPDNILPKNDIMFEFMHNFLRDYFQNGFGTPSSGLYRFDQSHIPKIFNNYEYKFVN